MAGAMQYVPELTWILFLRILDETEQREKTESAAVGAEFSPSLEKPYRWRDWASPGGANRKELQEAASGSFFRFVKDELLPYLKGLEKKPSATVRQKVISEILRGVDGAGIDTERNFLDVLDKVDGLTHAGVDDTHVFTLSQVYEGLLLKMGEKNNDGGQFFTPREVIRAMVKTVRPEIGEAVCDPGCGTGGFLVQGYEYMKENANTAEKLRMLKENTFYGREKEKLIYPIALANMVLHGIDHPRIWHGNTLTGRTEYGGLFEGAPPLFDVVLTNPPFGGKESEDAKTRFAYKTGSTQVLFLQEVMSSLKNGGRCGIVVDEGLLFRTNEKGFVGTKRKLLEEFDLWCVVSLPQGVFTQAGAGVKTNLLFFTKGKPTEKIWYYDLSGVKVNKGNPMTLAHFEEFFRLLPRRADGENSWTVDFAGRKREAGKRAAALKEDAGDYEPSKRAAEIENGVYDLKAVNPNRKPDIDGRTPEELMRVIEEKGGEIARALKELKGF